VTEAHEQAEPPESDRRLAADLAFTGINECGGPRVPLHEPLAKAMEKAECEAARAERPCMGVEPEERRCL
jgi:hypothetical protein